MNNNGKCIVKLKKALYGCVESAKLWYDCDLGGKGKGGLKAKRSLLVRDANRRYASNFCKAAQTS